MARGIHWSEYAAVAGGSYTDRGWLLALCAPYDRARYHEYNENTMPVVDDVPGGWREQSSLGNYLDYGPCRVGREGPQVHCVFYGSGESGYVATVADARVWLEDRARRYRPELFEGAAVAAVAAGAVEVGAVSSA